MFRKIFIPVLVILILNSCNDDLDVNADWKDITIVYGLLNLNEADSIHYIRINRAFLNEKTSAIAIARISDSIQYMDTLDVKLIEKRNGGLISTIELYPEINNDKDSGMFAYEEQMLYRTASGTVLNPRSTYHLEVRNPANNNLVSSYTTIVDNIEPVFPRNNQNITFNPESNVDFQWFDGKNAYFYDITLEITFYEFKKGSTNINERTLQWNLAKYYRGTQDVDEKDLITFSVQGQRFYDFIASQVEKDITLERTMKDMKLYFSAGGEEIFNYINVNQPSIGTIQKKPEYSNIENGFGVFSSRNLNIVKCKISRFTIEELQNNPASIDLNFTN